MKARFFVAAAAGIFVLTGCSAISSGSGGLLATIADVASDPSGTTSARGEGCGPAVRPALDEQFVRLDQMRSVPIYPVIREQAEVTRQAAIELGFKVSAPTDTGDRELQYRYRFEDTLVSYYSEKPIGDRDTFRESMADHGVILFETKGSGQSLVSAAAEALGDRAARIAIGSTLGVMNHGDEIAPGVRPYYVWWSEADMDWAIVSGAESATLPIDWARSIAC